MNRVCEKTAVAVRVLSDTAEIYFFASFFLTSLPAIADQSVLAPIAIWAMSATASVSEAPACQRTLGPARQTTSGQTRRDHRGPEIFFLYKTSTASKRRDQTAKLRQWDWGPECSDVSLLRAWAA